VLLLGAILMGTVNGPFQDTPWLGKVFGSIIGVILLIALLVWFVFAPLDLYRRDDIGPGKKLLWVAAFLLTFPLALIVYGAVRFSRTDGHPGW
jgi:ABC-type Fe3+-siderophore transport system permease subunit